jgi:hypothetical protein
MKCTIQVHKLKFEFVYVFFPTFYLKKKKPTYQPILNNVGWQQQTKNFLSLVLTLPKSHMHTVDVSITFVHGFN